MVEDFDRLLAGALAPEDRAPDRAFVTGVQSRIALHETLRVAWHGMLRRLAMELLALATVAAGLLWFTTAAPIDAFRVESPGLALGALLSGFAFLVMVMVREPNSKDFGQVNVK